MLDHLASSPDPYPTYASLRERGVHQPDDDRRWVVARAADATGVLRSPEVVVGFAPAPGDANAVVQTRMARFSDGDDHDRRRAVAVDHLAGLAPDALHAAARSLALERLGSAGYGEVDVMAELARTVPVAALAQALGAADPDAAVAATRELCLALAPPAGGPTGDAVAPAARLAALLGPATEINVVALLFQTMDATAGLIGNALLAARRFGVDATTSAEALVAETNRFDPSVQLTSRVAVRDLEVGGVTIPTGDRIVVLLAAANRDPDRFERPDEFDLGRGPAPAAFTFGAGARPCPGTEHALALAAGVVDGIARTGGSLANGPVDYEPRPNLRIPERITVRLR